MINWLKSDLAANSSKRCTLAMYHHPRFTSGHDHGSDPARTKTLFNVLYDNRVDVALSGHEHVYENLAPANKSGARDTTNGVKSFIVGTGGRSVSAPYFDSPLPITGAKMGGGFGVLRLTLHAGGYDYKFLPASGTSFTDSGSGMCH